MSNTEVNSVVSLVDYIKGEHAETEQNMINAVDELYNVVDACEASTVITIHIDAKTKALKYQMVTYDKSVLLRGAIDIACEHLKARAMSRMSVQEE